MIQHLSKIELWQQYQRSNAVKQYFAFFKDYLETNYKDLFFKTNKDGSIELGEFAKEFSINQAMTDYLEYYLKSVYGMQRPHYLVDSVFYDSGLKYDLNSRYDITGEAQLVPIPLLRKVFQFIYNIKYTHFSIPNLAGMIADFCDVPITDVKITPDKDLLKAVRVVLPQNRYSLDLRTVYNTYRNIFNLPIGFSMQLDLI